MKKSSTASCDYFSSCRKSNCLFPPLGLVVLKAEKNKFIIALTESTFGGMPVAQRLGTKLAQMDVQGLMALRKEVDAALSGHRTTLEKQLAALGDKVGNGMMGRRADRGAALRGKKVAAKYRSPDGETWAGRGAKPRWLVAAIKSGKKIESFLIDKSAGRKKRKSKG